MIMQITDIWWLSQVQFSGILTKFTHSEVTLTYKIRHRKPEHRSNVTCRHCSLSGKIKLQQNASAVAFRSKIVEFQRNASSATSELISQKPWSCLVNFYATLEVTANVRRRRRCRTVFRTMKNYIRQAYHRLEHYMLMPIFRAYTIHVDANRNATAKKAVSNYLPFLLKIAV